MNSWGLFGEPYGTDAFLIAMPIPTLSSSSFSSTSLPPLGHHTTPHYTTPPHALQVSTEEVHFQRRLRAILEPYGTVLKLVDSKPMVAPEDLPFGIEDTPDLYTSYRKVSTVPVS